MNCRFTNDCTITMGRTIITECKIVIEGIFSMKIKFITEPKMHIN